MSYSHLSHMVKRTPDLVKDLCDIVSVYNMLPLYDGVIVKSGVWAH